MYVVELKTGEWFCSESKKEIINIVGQPVTKESLEKINNLWFQPFNYLSGVMSDFFWTIKDGVSIDPEIAMRGWHKDLPLSKCISGNVKYLGKKEPKWYNKLLVNHIN